MRSLIVGTGAYSPDKVLTNADLEKLVDTNDQWIVERTGIRERRIAAADQATTDMALPASQRALEMAGVDPRDLDLIVMGTITPDMPWPSSAAILQGRLGNKKAFAFDVSAACAGSIYALSIADRYVSSGLARNALVIGAEMLSKIVDWKDRNTCILFGDGAGAMLVEAADDDDPNGFIGFLGEIDGSGAEYLRMPAGGSRMPPSPITIEKRLHYIHQEGQQVFKFAVRRMYEVCRDLLAKHNVNPQDIAIMIPHQANRRIITATADRLGLGCDKVLINIERYGNTTSATIPIATSEAIQTGKLKKGDLVLLAAVGAGFTVGASLWRWDF